jgi:hypothetical protein
VAIIAERLLDFHDFAVWLWASVEPVVCFWNRSCLHFFHEEKWTEARLFLFD